MTLHQWMTDRGLNDEALSQKLGRKLSRSQIYRIRMGECRPTLENARLLETVTNIPAASYLLGEAGSKAA